MSNLNINDINEVGKYTKKKDSNVSKASAKANHKHDYKEVLLIEAKSGRPKLGTVCSICGKIYNWVSPASHEGSFYRMLSDEEIFEQYKDYERIPVNSFFQKNV